MLGCWPAVTLSFSVFAHVLASFGITWALGSFCGSLCALFSFPFSFRSLCDLFFSDVLMSGIWNEVAVLEDPSLRSLVPDLLDLQMGSRASSTVTKYKSGWLRWSAWAPSKTGVSVILAKPLHIAFFITELTINCLASNMGVSSVEALVYGIKWTHSMAGLLSCPVSHPLVKSALEGRNWRVPFVRKSLCLWTQLRRLPISIVRIFLLPSSVFCSYC